MGVILAEGTLDSTPSGKEAIHHTWIIQSFWDYSAFS